MVNALVSVPGQTASHPLHRLLRRLILGLTALVSGLPPGHCDSGAGPPVSEQRVEVRAEGIDFASARNEAVRQAVQRVLPQVVTANRRIQNDRIVVDEVQSSLNGHVRHIEVLDTGPSPTGVWVRLTVTVSPQAVANYLDPAPPKGAQFSGQTLSGEQGREAQAREFRAQHVRHLLQGFPAHALQAWVRSIRPTDRAPGGLLLELNYQLKPSFLQQLQQGMEDMACNPRQPSQCSRTTLCFDRRELPPRCLTLAPGKVDTEYPLIYDAFLGEPHEGYRQPPSRQMLQFALLLRFKNQAGVRTGRRPCYDIAVQVDREGQQILTIPYTNIQDDSPIQAITQKTRRLSMNTFGFSHWFTDRLFRLAVEIPKQLLEQVDIAESTQVEALAAIRFDSNQLSSSTQEAPYYLFDITQPAVAISRRREESGQTCAWR